jgi:hypothetical protein
MENYADIIADEAMHGSYADILGPALLQNDAYTFYMYIGQLDSFDEWRDQLKYDGIVVGAEHMRMTLKNNGFFDLVAPIAQGKKDPSTLMR